MLQTSTPNCVKLAKNGKNKFKTDFHEKELLFDPANERKL
jgi:hypothetical protein